MNRRTYARLRDAVGLIALATACSPSSVGADASLSEGYTLTAETSIMAFEVTYCLEEPPTRSLNVNAWFTIRAETEGEASVMLERLDPVDDDLEFIDVVEMEDGRGTVQLKIIDGDDWSEGGKRCAGPIIVQVEAEGLDADQTVTLTTVDSSVSGDFFTGFCEEPLTGEAFSVELVPL